MTKPIQTDSLSFRKLWREGCFPPSPFITIYVFRDGTDYLIFVSRKDGVCLDSSPNAKRECLFLVSQSVYLSVVKPHTGGRRQELQAVVNAFYSIMSKCANYSLPFIFHFPVLPTNCFFCSTVYPFIGWQTMP